MTDALVISKRTQSSDEDKHSLSAAEKPFTRKMVNSGGLLFRPLRHIAHVSLTTI
jgi:hypothetical protein